MVKKLRKSTERSLRNRRARNSVKLVILAILLLYSCKRAQFGVGTQWNTESGYLPVNTEDTAGYQRQVIG